MKDAIQNNSNALDPEMETPARSFKNKNIFWKTKDFGAMEERESPTLEVIDQQRLPRNERMKVRLMKFEAN